MTPIAVYSLADDKFDHGEIMKLSRSLILALALTACSATAHRVAAQDLGPIDLNDFGMSNELPVNPLPGGPLAPRVDPPTFTAPSLKGKLFKTTQRSTSNSIAPSLTQPTIEGTHPSIADASDAHGGIVRPEPH